jgi:hypothetical protein
MIVIATKIIVGIHILIYFGISLVVCNNDIPFCRKRFNELRENEKDWRNRYLNGKGQNLATPRCEADKEYNHERMCMYKKICFHINKGNIKQMKTMKCRGQNVFITLMYQNRDSFKLQGNTQTDYRIIPVKSKFKKVFYFHNFF